MKITIDLAEMHLGSAKLNKLNEYMSQAQKLARHGNEIVLTGAAPVWLYLKLAHCLHGRATTLKYNSPATGEIVIYDHNPF